MDKVARPADRWRWLTLAVVPLYLLPFFLPFVWVNFADLMAGQGLGWALARLLDVPKWGAVAFGAEALKLFGAVPSLRVYWLAHPVLWVAFRALALKRWRVAGIAGAVALLPALVPLIEGMGTDLLCGYYAWLAAMVAVAAAGFVGASHLTAGGERTIRLGLAAAALGLTGYLVPVALLPRSYQGRSVRAWVEVLGEQPGFGDSVRACEVLAGIGPAAVPDLADALADPRPHVRLAAAVVLDRLGPGVEAAAPALAQATRIGDYQLSYLALKILTRMGPPGVPGLVTALGGVGSGAAREALVALGPAAVPAVLVGLRDPDLRARQEALNVLERCPRLPAGAVPPLLAALGDRDEQIRWKAMELLARVESPGVEVVPVVLKAVDPYRRNAFAAEILGRVGPPAIPALIATLKGGQHQIAEIASDVLVRIGAPAVPALTALLDDPDEATRDRAARTFGRIAPLTAFKDSRPWVRVKAITALGRAGSGGDAVVPSLRAALADPDLNLNLRAPAVEALGQIGPAAKAAVPDLLALADDRNTSLRMEVAVALHRIDPQGRDVLPAVEALARAPSSGHDRFVAYYALGRLGPAGVPALARAAIEERDPHFRFIVLSHIANMGGIDAAAAVPTLEILKDDANENVRKLASSALKAIRARMPHGK